MLAGPAARLAVARSVEPNPVWLANTGWPLMLTAAVPVTASDSAYDPAAGTSMVPVNVADHPLALTPLAGACPFQARSAPDTVPVAAGGPVIVVLL
jgi:hypothetical protein